MLLLLLAVVLLLASGVAAVFLSRSPRVANLIGAAGAVVACVVGLLPVVRVLAGGAVVALRCAWEVPYGAFYIEMDALSAFFLLPILGLSALAAVYGAEYMLAYEGKKSLGAPWFFFNLLVASMVMVVIARNGVLFLVAWEVMALASFFLVTFESEQASVREAGWTYLVATHLGTAFLLALFVLLGRESGSQDFDKFAGSGATAGLLFLLAVVGFGTKAGFMPLHVWLPEAHPAAPSHVSALMSGVMIKTGIYGLLRTLTWLDAPPPWWGWLLVGIGVTSGVGGVLFALAQHDLKRLLAYHSVENIGIIALGLGVGVLGLSFGLPALAVLGFAGGLLHVLNHALFKGLLFLGAGAVLHGTGTRDMDRLGGLLKRMPRTGLMFLVGAVAICGLPPLNGFVSEFLIYLGAYRGALAPVLGGVVPLLGVIVALALIGGLAGACFTKAFGIVFLGEPRSVVAAQAHEAGLAMRLPMVVLAAACVIVGLAAPLVVGQLGGVVASVSGLPAETVRDNLAGANGPLVLIVAAAGILLALVAALTLLRRWLLAGREVGATVTWDCGYAEPVASMQYTSSSFAQPLTEMFHFALRTHEKLSPPTEIFPRAASLATDTPDACRESVFAPVFAGVARALAPLRWLQHGRLQLYVLYIALTLLALLVWRMG